MKESRASSESATWVAGGHTLGQSAAFPGHHHQGDGWKVEQPGHTPAPSGRLAGRVTVSVKPQHLPLKIGNECFMK